VYAAPATEAVPVVEVPAFVTVLVFGGTFAVTGRVTAPRAVVVRPGEPAPPSAEWMRIARIVTPTRKAAGAP
jgi:hypothetical protein